MDDAVTPAPVRLLLADDDALVRSGLRLMLGGVPDRVQVVAEAADGRAALAALDLHRVDLVLMDLRMPVLDGIATTRLLRERPDAPPVLILTTFGADELVLGALRAGAAGFLLKDTPPAELVRAIERVAAGDGTLSPAVTGALIALVADDGGAAERARAAAERLAALSPREHDVATLIGRGAANAAIAAELHLSVPTIKAHVSRVMQKLGCDNRVQIALLTQEAAGVP